MKEIIINTTQPVITTKKCGKCQKELSLDQFRNQTNARLKKNSYCNRCILAYNKNRYAQNKDKGREYMKQWRKRRKKHENSQSTT